MPPTTSSLFCFFLIVCLSIGANAFNYQGTPLKCGSVTYDINTQTCCSDDNLNSYVVNQPGLLCCGSAGGYDFLTQICRYIPTVGHQILSKNPAAPVSSLLCSATASLTDGTLYSPATSTCCIGSNNDLQAVVYPGIQACCGSLKFDPTNEVCCSDKYGRVSVGQGNSLACCGSQAYDPAASTCCTDATGASYLYSGGGLNSRCCNGKLLDPTNQICCQNAAAVDVTDVNTAKCCGLEAYYPPKETCCLGSKTGILHVAISNLESAESNHLDINGPLACCGGAAEGGSSSPSTPKRILAYDPTKQQCCNGRLKKLTDSC
eukprot:TRINITY_DN8132_c0_g1_i1.p1 TRINITY_DN8132_c0_g1~~TRINITY_DN8132_c0_g1_i1.p1  ORF type:complete len:319 (-),score=38.26 TRINITY_DN8132_c0_g1_i1:164-1120(-)